MKKLSILSLFILTLFACRKDIEENLSEETIIDNPTTTIIDYTPEVIEVTATVFGLIVDENGNAVANAAIRLDNNNTTTDDKGRFAIPDVTMNQLGTFVQATKNGYFVGSDRFFPAPGSVNYVKITLLERSETGNFESTDGGLINSTEGIELFFPVDAIVDEDGDAYDGPVSVFARWIDPTADNVDEIMPGGLQGINQDVELMALASFGMMAVELESNTGAPLNLGNNKKATLTFPVAPGQNAPSQIPLWYFSDNYGVWIEDGTATLNNGKYVGDVSHFSWWNCDDPYTLIELWGTVNTSNDSAAAYVSVCLELISTGEVGCIYTNQDGFFSGPVPMNEEFIMTISQWNACNTLTMNIGPFTDNTDLGIITLPLDPDFVEITGNVIDCSDDPVNSGFVEMTVGTDIFNYYVTDGSFSFSFYNCDNVTELSIVATDLSNLTQGDVETYNISSPLNLVDVDACGNQLPEWFIIDVDGITNTFVDVGLTSINPGDTLVFNGQLGNFSVNLKLANITGTGSYDNTNVKLSTHFIASSTGTLSNSCGTQWGPSCTYDEVTITEFGPNIGDFIAGTYSGTLDFLDSSQQVVSHFVSADFKVMRD